MVYISCVHAAAESPRVSCRRGGVAFEGDDFEITHFFFFQSRQQDVDACESHPVGQVGDFRDCENDDMLMLESHHM